MTRLAIVAALEALEVGDLDLAVVILIDALEDRPTFRRFVCGHCGARFEWPGLRDHHVRLACWRAQDAA